MPTIEFTGRDIATRAGAATRALTRAAVAAGNAPSFFNSQPWRWRIAGDVAELRADRQRQVNPIDVEGRLLTISCGAALHHARTALAGAGVQTEVVRMPDPADRDLLARIRVTGVGASEPTAVRWQQAMALRRTDRRPFADVDVPDATLDTLHAAAEAHGAHLHLLRPDDVVTLTVAAGHAAAVEAADHEYRAQLAEWTHRPASAGDGVPATAAGTPVPRPVPLRDFNPDACDPTANAGPPAGPELFDRHARYAVLFTDTDTAASWLAAGEALSAVLLTVTTERLAACPMSDVVEIPATRRLLRDLLGGIGYPALAIRIGVPGDGPMPPATQILDLPTPLVPST
jgi:hypothetical protein